MHKEALAHAPVFFSRCPTLKRAPTTSYSPHRLCGFCGTAHVRPTVRHHDGGIIVVINMMFQIIKTILAIIGIIFGGIFILGMLIDGAAWRFLMGLALLGPAVWWFMTKPGQRRWKAVIPLALLSFFAGVGIAPDTEPEQPAAAVMATPSSSSTPTTTKKTTTSRPTTTSPTHHRHNNIGTAHNQHRCLRDAGCVRQSHGPLCARSRAGPRHRAGTGVSACTNPRAGNRSGAECLLPEL